MTDSLRVSARSVGHVPYDTAELLLVDIAMGRYAPGDVLDPATICREHGVTIGDVQLALYEMQRMKLIIRSPFSEASLLVWHRHFNEVLLGDLVRMITVASSKLPALKDVPEMASRRSACTAHGLTLPCDVTRFLDLGRQLVQVLSPSACQHVRDDLLLPLEILCTTQAIEVHGMKPVLGEAARAAIVDLMERAARHGDWTKLPRLASDYVTALRADTPRTRIIP